MINTKQEYLESFLVQTKFEFDIDSVKGHFDSGSDLVFIEGGVSATHTAPPLFSGDQGKTEVHDITINKVEIWDGDEKVLITNKDIEFIEKWIYNEA